MTKTSGRGRLKRVLIIFGSVSAVLVGLLGGGFAWLWTGADGHPWHHRGVDAAQRR
ncbi:hypothetical protein AB0M87_11430 [Streptomyces sp. NPDC051320]|uniref:hypothetical protein n=1 Tax=Streptomyces sp. NPDC051320 TaxID=3154644 RepID=UPI00341B4816